MLPNTLTSIGESAFEGCTGLSNITLPSGLSSIGRYAFYGCTGLSEILLPDSVSSLSSYVFANCSNLTAVNYPRSLSRCGSGIFNGCSSLTTITIPEGVTTLPDNTFDGSPFKEIFLPETLLSIGKSAFSNCSELRYIIVPSNVSSIGNDAFSNCRSLRYVRILSMICRLGRDVFYNSPYLNVYCKSNSEAVLYVIENSIPFLLIAADPEDYSGYVMDMDQTDFYTAVSVAVESNYVPFALDYSVKNDMYPYISNPRIVITLSKDLELIEKSVMMNGSPVSSYKYENGKLTIPVSLAQGTIRFSAIPVTTGTISTFAQFCYTLSGEKAEKIGIAYLDVPLLTLYAPDQIDEPSFKVNGISKPNAKIDIVFGETVIASATAKKDGLYSAFVTLPQDLVAGTAYEIKAFLHDEQSVSAVKNIIYKSDKPVLTQFDMYYYAPTICKMDLLNVESARINSQIYPGKPFKFIVSFDHPESIDTVYITSIKNGITSKMPAYPTANPGEYIAEGFFDGTDEKTYIPGNINVHYTVHFTAEDFQIDLPYEELPIEWQNAVVEDTSTAEVKSGTITLEDGAVVEYELREGLSPSETLEMFFPSDNSSLSSNSSDFHYRSASVPDDEDLKIVLDLFDELKKKYKENVITNSENLAKEGKNGVAVIHDDIGEKFSYVFWDPVKTTCETVSIKLVGTYYIQENSPGVSWSDSGKAWSFIWETGKTINHMLEDYESVSETKALIQTSPVLSDDDKTYALGKMDDILLGYGVVNLLRMVSAATGYALAATHPVAAVLVPFVMNQFIGLLDKYLDDAMAFYAAGGKGLFFRWIIDPSGIVFDPETGAGIPGVTVTAYCILPDEDEPDQDFWNNVPSETQYGEVWDASEYSQENPLITGADGSYSWDVPEGWWRVKFEKTGYETSWSKWMAVPPIQTEVDIQLTQQGGFKISNSQSTASSETFIIKNTNESTANILVIISGYNSIGDMTISSIHTAKIGSNKKVSYVFDFNSANVSKIKVFILNPSTYAPLRVCWQKSVR